MSAEDRREPDGLCPWCSQRARERAARTGEPFVVAYKLSWEERALICPLLPRPEELPR